MTVGSQLVAAENIQDSTGFPGLKLHVGPRRCYGTEVSNYSAVRKGPDRYGCRDAASNAGLLARQVGEHARGVHTHHLRDGPGRYRVSVARLVPAIRHLSGVDLFHVVPAITVALRSAGLPLRRAADVPVAIRHNDLSGAVGMIDHESTQQPRLSCRPPLPCPVPMIDNANHERSARLRLACDVSSLVIPFAGI